MSTLIKNGLIINEGLSFNGSIYIEEGEFPGYFMKMRYFLMPTKSSMPMVDNCAWSY